MSRHRNKATGVVVSVSDEKDARFGEGWESADSRPEPEAQEPERPEEVEPDEADTAELEAEEPEEVEPDEAPPAPVKRGPGRPRKSESE